MDTLSFPLPPSASSDSDWVGDLRRGEPRALAELYDAHHAPVCSFALRLLGDAPLAEDLVQEVFLAFPKLCHKLRPGASVRAFLLSITANRARHYFRSAARRERLAEQLAQAPGGHSSDPEQTLEQARLASVLHSALGKLPSDQRVAFVLCAVEGLSSAEAAEILSVPEATVRTRLFHARRKLRARLTREGVR